MSAAKERSAKALAMRLAGQPYEVIARECGYASRASAWKAVQRALVDEHGDVDANRSALRLEMVGQLDLLWRRAMKRVMQDGSDAMRAVDSAARVLDRKARLLGLDAPTKVELTTELDEEIDRLVEQMSQLSGAEDPVGGDA